MNKLFLVSILVSLTCSTCEVLQEVVQDPSFLSSVQSISGDLLGRFNQQSPISTTFDDAIYEASSLSGFEPDEEEYIPLDIQPKAETGGYILKSGLYTMNAKSFCLRGYTHGPSRGDGHLYAPLKGKKAGFVEQIIQRFGERPDVNQQDVQVLLWAIIAGADMNSLGDQHTKTLSQLFSTDELLLFQGKDWLNGLADEQVLELRRLANNSKVSPYLNGLIEADSRIRSMVRESRSFRDFEAVAVIAGAAPRTEMIREVSKGRWSYHPDGYFVRFFPNGYPQTRIDVYVPYEDEVQYDWRGAVSGLDRQSNTEKEVTFKPSSMTAMPANRASQRIGPSEAPTESNDKYHIAFFAYGAGKEFKDENGNVIDSSPAGHIFVGFYKNGKRQRIRGLSPTLHNAGVNKYTDESHLIRYHDEKFVREVSKREFYDAWFITKDEWVLLFNDCVSYADDVADVIGLDTPVMAFDPLDFSFPLLYLQYLKRNNTSHRN